MEMLDLWCHWEKWLNSSKANRAGRQHVYEYHNGEGHVSILIRETDHNGCKKK